MRQYIAGISVFLAITVASLRSQNTAVLFGTITDPAGAVVAGARVELQPLPSGQVVSVLADSSGRYALAGLAAGSYQLKVAVPGFKVHIVIVQIENAAHRLSRDIALEVGAASESVSVSASLPIMATSAAQVRVRVPARGIRRRNAPPNTEGYDDFVENEFAATRSQPLSTFSVDVDTASYSNVRRILNEGRLPPAGSVRIEELINYFTYDYPLPESGKPVSMTTHVLASPWNPGRQLLHVGLRTAPIPFEKLPPSSLTFLVDVSGSMQSEDKLPLVRNALKLLARQLRDVDKVSIVVYAGAAGVVLPPTPGSQKTAILEAIGELEAGGSTNGAEGILSAYRLARESFLEKGNNRVILCTDGDFNVGVSSDDELVRLIEKQRESGVFLSVFGFGTGNLKDSKMEKLADHGNGAYAYIDTLAEARKVFVQQLGATLVTVAKDVKLQIEFNPRHVKGWRLVGYENRVLRAEEFNDDKKDAGDLGAGHQVTAFYEIVPASSREDLPGVDRLRYQEEPKDKRKSGSDELAWIKLRHKKPQGSKSELLQWPVGAGAMPFDSAPSDVRFAAAVAEYGMLLRDSKFAGRASFDHIIMTAREAQGSDERRAEFVALVEKAQSLKK